MPRTILVSDVFLMFVGVFMISICPEACADGLPDGSSWFIQQLASGSYHAIVQVSDTYAVWSVDDPFSGTYYYDGTGIYELQYEGALCRSPSLSGSSIVCRTAGGILYYSLGFKRLIQTGQSYFDHPDVCGSQVVWEAGPSSQQTNIYYDGGQGILCLTDNAQCFYNGTAPKIAGSTLAWLSHDGHDHEVFIMENGVIRQLTNNDTDVYHWEGLHLAANGHLGWTSIHPVGNFYAHYYDGTYIRQLTVGDTHSSVVSVFERGVLYISYSHESTLSIVRLMLFDGTDTIELYKAPAYEEIFGAAAGGYSIAWIERESSMNDYRLCLLKGDELIVRSIGSDLIPHHYKSIAVWGNRLVWPQGDGELYFGRYLGSPACVNPPRMDATGDCRVNLDDFAVFASEWLSCGYDNPNACL